jgi:hypothetical protein
MDGSSTDEVPETEDEDTFDVFADYDVAHEGLPDANNEEEEAQEGPAHAPNNAPTFDVGADALFDDESRQSSQRMTSATTSQVRRLPVPDLPLPLPNSRPLR